MTPPQAASALMSACGARLSAFNVKRSVGRCAVKNVLQRGQPLLRGSSLLSSPSSCGSLCSTRVAGLTLRRWRAVLVEPTQQHITSDQHPPSNSGNTRQQAPFDHGVDSATCGTQQVCCLGNSQQKWHSFDAISAFVEFLVQASCLS